MKVPTNIITGFLGTGKTTAILNLLKTKPHNENWAVLVNEFGEIGIDGALLNDHGALIKQVPGGCMCCAAGVPLSVAVTALLRTQPDRLLVEPTGLGHAHKMVATLTSSQFSHVIDLRATIGLVDPRYLSQSKYMDNQNFNDQLAISDVVVGNKVDQCLASDIEIFNDWVANQQPAKIYSQLVKQGKFPIELLDNPRLAQVPLTHIEPHHHKAESSPLALDPNQIILRKENKGQGYFSCGWLFSAKVMFGFDALFSMLSDITADRVKGVMKTERGYYEFNLCEGVMSVNEMAITDSESRIEVIDKQPLPWDQLEDVLKRIAGLD
ncbi:CobW family GTP-binding protein [Vibrio ostreicida]|uniref:GTP-binding protein n=1 Tax=Vibrio ostreicida TaxID=526588 RepID=A0ABT8BX59_9VIBR|nr:GTP-binding protein [Vibrio ostreicida]MDN3611730.1 GTP-binding protein [Vibrio ostreicida]NPD09545.1 GTP-binding protein [Vibrio ostreicida]